MGRSDNLLAQNAKALLGGNSLNELQPALQAADTAGRNNQRSFSGQLAKSGLTGSGYGLGGKFGIQNQTDVNKQNILAGLPGLRRENLAALFPYFSRYLTDREYRTKGLADLQLQRGSTEAAGTAQKWNTVSNSIGGGGATKGQGGVWNGPGGQTAPAGGGGGGKGGGGGGK
jgi:hypothetical protein